MADASQFPVTFGYKAVDGYFYGPSGRIGPYHRGQDREMGMNTPVIINGNTTIGFSGNSGASSNPHLHVGRFVNGKDTDPQGQGFQLKAPARVTQIGQDDINGKFVAINDADGVRYVYLHLNSQTAYVNQIIKEGEDMAVIAQLQQQNRDLQEQINIMRPDLVESHRQIDGLRSELLAEREGYETMIEMLKKQIRDMQAATNTAITTAAKAAPTATRQPWYVRLVAALTSKK